MSTLPQEAHAWLRPGIPQYGFQLLGVDFMLDEELQVSAGCSVEYEIPTSGGRGTSSPLPPALPTFPLSRARFPPILLPLLLSFLPRAQPWLLEFNSSPSIMVEHDDPATQRVGRERELYRRIGERERPGEGDEG